MIKVKEKFGCLLCPKNDRNIIHPIRKKTECFTCRECNQDFPTIELLDVHLSNCRCSANSKRDINCYTPAVSSFDENHALRGRKEEYDQSLLEKIFMRKSTMDKTPQTQRGSIFSFFPFVRNSSVDVPPSNEERGSPRGYFFDEKSDIMLGGNSLSKIMKIILSKPLQTRIKMEAKFIKFYMNKKASIKYLISETWMAGYSCYLNGDRKDLPGPIDNRELKKQISRKTSGGNIYAVNETVWSFLKGLYGGGPEITHSTESSSQRMERERVKSTQIDEIHFSEAMLSKRKSFAILTSPRPLLSDSDSYNTRASVVPNSLKPIGMVNESFDSYLNASLQILMGLPDLMKCMDQNKYLDMLNTKSPKFWKALQDVFDATAKDENNFTPSLFKKLAKTKFSKKEQHDPLDFIVFALEGLQSECHVEIVDPEANNQNGKNPDEVAYVNYFNLPTINEMFSGTIISRIKCLNCGKKAQTEEEFLSLSLPIIPDESRTIDDCLAIFNKEHEDGSLHYCKSCNEETRASVQPVVYKYPKNLIIQLQRLPTSPNEEKINDFINYLSDNWKLAGKSDKEPRPYSLMGVIAHNVVEDSENFFSYTKRGDEWFLCNNEEVRRVAPKRVITQDAYILFYQRKG